MAQFAGFGPGPYIPAEQSTMSVLGGWANTDDQGFDQHLVLDHSNTNGVGLQYSGAANVESGVDTTFLDGTSIADRNTSSASNGFISPLQTNFADEFTGLQRDLQYQGGSPQSTNVGPSWSADDYQPNPTQLQAKKTRRSNKKPLTKEEEAVKAQMKKNRNSEAAAKCRQKKKLKIHKLESDYKQTETELRRYKAEASFWRNEVTANGKLCQACHSKIQLLLGPECYGTQGNRAPQQLDSPVHYLHNKSRSSYMLLQPFQNSSQTPLEKHHANSLVVS